MGYYAYNIETGIMGAFSSELENIITSDEIGVIETTDLDIDVTKKVVNGTLVVDQEKVAEIAAIEVRQKRNTLLVETDWWAVSDRTMTQAEIDYRQALRDVPEQAGFPHNITWPTKP